MCCWQAQERHRASSLHELPDERGFCRGEHIDEELRVRRWLYGGCGERGELRGVRGGDIQECRGLCDVHELPEQYGVRCGS